MALGRFRGLGLRVSGCRGLGFLGVGGFDAFFAEGGGKSEQVERFNCKYSSILIHPSGQPKLYSPCPKTLTPNFSLVESSESCCGLAGNLVLQTAPGL